ncbi:la-related protein 6-like protein [Leptotrombidium deliense]|uniref:La-related protein 6-like protein n=1 Tax=Leptotrombidium deliense TaxID=299467 RepID=A0A443S1Y0_9ACAR|nr:la-related protein 6-like protein [Leptotrombidium deliense]
MTLGVNFIVNNSSFEMTLQPLTDILGNVENCDEWSSAESSGRNSRCDSLGEKDSGVDCNDDLSMPDKELMEKVVAQIEFYFDDINLVNDAFLLKHIRRSKDGFVNIKLVTAFRKVKNLTKDWKVVAASVKFCSKKLEMNESLTKVRRVTPLPEHIDCNQRSLVAYQFPFAVNAESVSRHFENFGKVNSVRIVNKGGTIPSCIRHLTSKHCEISNYDIALIEFESKAVVDAVVKSFNSKQTNWRKSVRVYKVSESESSNKKSTNKNEDKTIVKQILKKDSTSSTNTEDKSSSTLQNNSGFRSRIFMRQKSLSYSENPNSLRNITSNSVTVIRMPKGPDGTKGFHTSIVTKLRSDSQP